ncbi:helix-turn-helix transcriptional regulator [Paramagnetospirillum magneticum]|uniref:Helix-turn-helix domain-containing protein n=1 Tax=Paramagnetospirillum magneticum (strain ATCC 700264 / AMB-1) TaxID=342108 RepID=Q2WA34_PARM1|nr:hypothetical protein [Paramagnetospirillum magneticum]BAE49291.1 hypothetical protein amb0487 [Paramagnetospirillum magneticum AMB-1]
MNDLDPITLTVPAALRASGLGRTKFYELIAAEKIKTIKIGSRRLVVYSSLKDLLSGEDPEQ